MKIQTLSSTPLRYLYIEINDKTFNDKEDYYNFNELLLFIGKLADTSTNNYPYPTDNNRYIGNAYRAIKNKIKERYPHSPLLFVSKREIKSTRKYYVLLKSYRYIKIPYKVCLIFEAIDNIVREYTKKSELPTKLSKLKGQKTYGDAFYKRYINVAIEYKNHIDNNNYTNGKYNPTEELLNDLLAPKTIFNQIFLGTKIKDGEDNEI